MSVYHNDYVEGDPEYQEELPQVVWLDMDARDFLTLSFDKTFDTASRKYLGPFFDKPFISDQHGLTGCRGNLKIQLGRCNIIHGWDHLIVSVGIWFPLIYTASQVNEVSSEEGNPDIIKAVVGDWTEDVDDYPDGFYDPPEDYVSSIADEIYDEKYEEYAVKYLLNKIKTDRALKVELEKEFLFWYFESYVAQRWEDALYDMDSLVYTRGKTTPEKLFPVFYRQVMRDPQMASSVITPTGFESWLKTYCEENQDKLSPEVLKIMQKDLDLQSDIYQTASDNYNPHEDEDKREEWEDFMAERKQIFTETFFEEFNARAFIVPSYTGSNLSNYLIEGLSLSDAIYGVAILRAAIPGNWDKLTSKLEHYTSELQLMNLREKFLGRISQINSVRNVCVQNGWKFVVINSPLEGEA